MDHCHRGSGNLKKPTGGFMRDPGRLDDTGLGDGACAVVERGEFCAYGIGTQNLENPPVEWNGSDTYIQKTGINHDYGVFDSPDAFYAKHGPNLSGPRRILYVYAMRHLMNAKVARIRARGARAGPSWTLRRLTLGESPSRLLR
jgi:hypothetical protein